MIELPTASSRAEPNLDRQRQVIALWLNLDWGARSQYPCRSSRERPGARTDPLGEDYQDNDRHEQTDCAQRIGSPEVDLLLQERRDDGR